MKTESLQICTRETRTACSMLWMGCPEHGAFKNWDENHTVSIGLRKWDPFKSQLGIWNFPKETNEEGNGSPVKPVWLSGCKHAWVSSESRLCAGTLHSPLSPALSPTMPSSPACTNMNPPVARMMHPKSSCSLCRACGLSSAAASVAAGGCSPAKPASIFPFQWKPRNGESKQAMEGFSVSLDKHSENSSKEAN